MSTTKPATASRTHTDSVDDDLGQAQTTIDSAIQTLNSLINAVGAASLLNLASAGGLATNAQASGTPDDLKIKLQTQSALTLAAAGLAVNVTGLTDIGTPDGTDELLIYDVGSAAFKKVLKSAVASGGGLSLLTSSAVTPGAASIAFSSFLTSGAAENHVVIQGTKLNTNSNNALLELEVSSDGGSTYLTNVFSQMGVDVTATPTLGAIQNDLQSELRFHGAQGNLAAENLDFIIDIRGFNSTYEKQFWAMSINENASGTIVGQFTWGRIESTAQLDAFKLEFNGAELFDGGTVRVYGEEYPAS